MGLALIWSLANVLQVFFICGLFRLAYDPPVSGKCGNRVASFIAIGRFQRCHRHGYIVDTHHTVWTVKACVGVKIALTAIFSLGLLRLAFLLPASSPSHHSISATTNPHHDLCQCIANHRTDDGNCLYQPAHVTFYVALPILWSTQEW